jgi:hypothetical protein
MNAAPKEAAAETAPRKKAGWPKGKPRGPRSTFSAHTDDSMKTKTAAAASMISKMKAMPNWESEDYVGVGLDGTDKLHIPPELIQSLQTDGVSLQWVTHKLRGRDEPGELAKMVKGGWTPVNQSDFDGVLDGLFLPKGMDAVITVGDCMLTARPVEIQAKSKMYERQEARRPVRVVEEQIGKGLPGISGGDHPTARMGNTIKKSFERIEIPE